MLALKQVRIHIYTGEYISPGEYIFHDINNSRYAIYLFCILIT